MQDLEAERRNNDGVQQQLADQGVQQTASLQQLPRGSWGHSL